jgi:hypothetical protein
MHSRRASFIVRLTFIENKAPTQLMKTFETEKGEFLIFFVVLNRIKLQEGFERVGRVLNVIGLKFQEN